MTREGKKGGDLVERGTLNRLEEASRLVDMFIMVTVAMTS